MMFQFANYNYTELNVAKCAMIKTPKVALGWSSIHDQHCYNCLWICSLLLFTQTHRRIKQNKAKKYFRGKLAPHHHFTFYSYSLSESVKHQINLQSIGVTSLFLFLLVFASFTKFEIPAHCIKPAHTHVIIICNAHYKHI